MATALALPHLFEPDVSSTDELLACISAAEGGDYMRVPVGQDDLSRALASLLRTLQRDTTRNLGHVVDASIGANEVGIMSANLLHQLYCLDEDSQTIAATSEGMAAKTAEIGEYAEEIDSSAKAASAAVTRNERILEQANAQMRIVLQTVTDANEKIAGLHALTDRVMELTQSVRKIASQTRLLAINAAVEAARAGEAGRGFSVVATEVKALADHSSSATAEIGQIVSAFSEAMRSMMVVMSTTKTAAGTGSDVMGELTGSLQEVGTNIASVSASTSSIATALRQQSEVSAEIAGQISRTALSTNETTNSIEAIVDRIDMTQAAITSQVNVYATMNFPKKVIKLAQSDHVIWKKRLANMIIGRERLNANELADHRSCRLGKWYESVSEPALVGAKAFADLNAPHVLVHKHGIEATRLFAAGDTPAALREIGKVEDASRLVLSLLKTLEQT